MIQQLSSNNCILFCTSQNCTIIIFENLKKKKNRRNGQAQYPFSGQAHLEGRFQENVFYLILQPLYTNIIGSGLYQFIRFRDFPVH